MQRTLFTAASLSCRGVSVRQVHEETDQVESADTYESVDNPGKPWHITKDIGYQVKTEQTDQRPVNGTNDRNGKRSTVQKFISHISLISADYRHI